MESPVNISTVDSESFFDFADVIEEVVGVLHLVVSTKKVSFSHALGRKHLHGLNLEPFAVITVRCSCTMSDNLKNVLELKSTNEIGLIDILERITSEDVKDRR